MAQKRLVTTPSFLLRPPIDHQQAASQLAFGGSAGGLPAMRAQDFAPDHSQCSPKCSYQCTNPTCEQVCDAVCESPKCETRCGGTDLSACFMQCGKPHCAVVCPEKPCAGPNCPSCATKCSEPMCMLQCPKAQPCHNVCEHPKCNWKCRAPDSCPKPDCHMTCETPSNCLGSTFQQLPPLSGGEMLVQSFSAPTFAARGRAASLAEATRMPQAAPRTAAGRPEGSSSMMSVPVYVGAVGPTLQSQDFIAPQQMLVQMPVVNLPSQ